MYVQLKDNTKNPLRRHLSNMKYEAMHNLKKCLLSGLKCMGNEFELTYGKK